MGVEPLTIKIYDAISILVSFSNNLIDIVVVHVVTHFDKGLLEFWASQITVTVEVEFSENLCNAAVTVDIVISKEE